MVLSRSSLYVKHAGWTRVNEAVSRAVVRLIERHRGQSLQ